MKNKFIVLFTGFLFVFLSSGVYACEKCFPTLNLEETVAESDLIIIGQKISEGPHTDPRPDGYGGPDWIEIEIEKIVKGQTKEKKIKVNSWDAMCRYGIIIDDQKYIMFLKERNVEDETYEYDAVNYGCAVKTYLIKEDMVEFERRKFVPMDEFINELKI